jgi:hypothetical protein
MRHCIPFLPLVLLLAGCEKDQPVTHAHAPDPWPNEAEVVFQTAEALKYSVEQQKLEIARLKAQGIEGNPPSSR